MCIRDSGKIVDNTFGPDDRETPAVRINDGVDYVVMPQWKLFLVQDVYKRQQQHPERQLRRV